MFSGTVEVDETYLGGKWKNKRLSERKKGTFRGRETRKTPVFGILCWGGKVWAQTRRETHKFARRLCSCFGSSSFSPFLNREGSGYSWSYFSWPCSTWLLCALPRCTVRCFAKKGVSAMLLKTAMKLSRACTAEGRCSGQLGFSVPQHYTISEAGLIGGWPASSSRIHLLRLSFSGFPVPIKMVPLK